MVEDVRNYSVGGGSDSGDDEDVTPLPLFDAVMVFGVVTLGILTSIALVTWALSWIVGFVGVGMALAPIQLLMLVRQVVFYRAVSDWYSMHSKPLLFRLFRVFCIGVTWPLWIKRM